MVRLSNQAELSLSDQQLFLDWLDRRESARVLTGSPRAIFPLVQEGSPVADLYYRLNAVLLFAS